jgi:8-oxo-dGTP diphosphatase
VKAVEDLYHLGVKALIRNAEGQLLLLKVNPGKLKGNEHGAYWDMPGGRVQQGSSVEATLARELEEETGLTDIASSQPFAMVLSNIRIPQHPAAAAHSAPTPAATPDVGLVLSVYLCEVGDAGTIRLSDEHAEYAWMTPGQAAAMLQVKYPGEFTDKIREFTAGSGQRTANIGCEAYLTRGDQVLLGKRGKIFGSGTWALPGGHLEFMERADATLARELAEEVGLKIPTAGLTLLALTDDINAEAGTHYLHLTFAAEVPDGQEPQVLEPEECEEWRWFPKDQLPDNLFPPHAKILATIATGHVYSQA